MNLKIDNYIVDIFDNAGIKEEVPVIILNTYEREGKEVFEECLKLNCSSFILVAISNIDWNNDLTPWKCPPLFKGDKEYLGYASNYLSRLEKDILPQIKDYINSSLKKKINYYAIAGYSLAGLFSIYSCFNSDKFKRAVSCSGSLWYPNFLEYVKDNKINENVSKVYLSLGKGEKNTKNNVLSKVYDNTLEIYEILRKNIDVFYEENEGNHFQNSVSRMAKGIKNILN